MDLDFPLNPFNHLKGNTKRDLIEVISNWWRFSSLKKSWREASPSLTANKKNMPLSRWTRAFPLGVESLQAINQAKPMTSMGQFWFNTSVFFPTMNGSSTTMDRFSSQLVWCHMSKSPTPSNQIKQCWATDVYFCRNFDKNASKILSSYHPPSTPKNQLPYTPLSERKQCSGVSAEPGSTTSSGDEDTIRHRFFNTHSSRVYIAKLSTTHALKRTSSDLKLKKRSCLRSFPILQLWIHEGFCKSRDATSTQNCPKIRDSTFTHQHKWQP